MMRAMCGGKPKNDPIDASKIVTPIRDGMLLLACVDPGERQRGSDDPVG